jgi:hypothetical protein
MLWNNRHNLQTRVFCLGFEVLTAVVMKSSVVWDKKLCSPLKVSLTFQRTCFNFWEGHTIACLFEALYYKLKGCGFDS